MESTGGAWRIGKGVFTIDRGGEVLQGSSTMAVGSMPEGMEDEDGLSIHSALNIYMVSIVVISALCFAVSTPPSCKYCTPPTLLCTIFISRYLSHEWHPFCSSSSSQPTIALCSLPLHLTKFPLSLLGISAPTSFAHLQRQMSVESNQAVSSLVLYIIR